MCVVAGLLDRTAPRAAFRSGARSHSIGVSGASWSYAVGAVGALVQADGVWVRVTGSEALKTGVAGKGELAVQPRRKSSISLKEGRMGKLFFLFLICLVE